MCGGTGHPSQPESARYRLSEGGHSVGPTALCHIKAKGLCVCVLVSDLGLGRKTTNLLQQIFKIHLSECTCMPHKWSGWFLLWTLPPLLTNRIYLSVHRIPVFKMTSCWRWWCFVVHSLWMSTVPLSWSKPDSLIYSSPYSKVNREINNYCMHSLWACTTCTILQM